MRAVAALAVVLFHVLEGTNFRWPIGRMGVDVFFILSGFLMFAVTASRPVTALAFFKGRVIRIAPVYWVASLLTFAIAWGAPGLQPHASADPVLLANSLLFLPYPDAAHRLWPTVFLGWTLNYEMFFYVVFAAMLGLSVRLRLLALSLVLPALVAASLVLDPANRFVAVYTSPLVLEFLAGAWLGHLLVGPARPSAQRWLWLAGTVAMLAALGQVMPELHYAWLAALLLGAGVMLEPWMPRIAVLSLLGDASYSIYLFQQLGFDLVDNAFHVAARQTPFWIDRAEFRAPVELVVAIGLGIAVHFCLERPLVLTMKSLAARRRLVGAV